MSININIISGFLGAGKTTFLKKVIPNIEGKVVLIENEFGDIGIDGDLLNDKLPIREIYAGCICCSVVHDLKKAIEELSIEYKPDHIFIEPSGVGSLSDIIKACKKISENSNIDLKINQLITIVDISSFEDYIESFGEFYLDQIQNANIILLSHFNEVDKEECKKIIPKIRLNNQSAFILNEEWYSYNGEKLIEILNTIKSCEIIPKNKRISIPADKLFGTVSVASPRIFSKEEIEKILASLNNKEYGSILRAKGILKLDDGKFINFNFTPNHYNWEYIETDKESKVVVIGCNLEKQKILDLFN